MPAVGLLLLVVSLLVFKDGIRHPSLITLIPVGATMLLIWFTNGSEPVSRLLGSRPFVAIGLTSYSFYLWHFPIFAFARIQGQASTQLEKGGYIALAFALSCLTYFTIEKPSRNRGSVKTSVFLIAVVSSLLTLAGIELFFYKTNGASFRMESVKAYSEFQIPEYDRLSHSEVGTLFRDGQKSNSCRQRDPREACEFGNGEFITMGDSYVGQYETALMRRLSPRNLGLISFNYAISQIGASGRHLESAKY